MTILDVAAAAEAPKASSPEGQTPSSLTSPGKMRLMTWRRYCWSPASALEGVPAKAALIALAGQRGRRTCPRTRRDQSLHRAGRPDLLDPLPASGKNAFAEAAQREHLRGESRIRRRRAALPGRDRPAPRQAIVPGCSLADVPPARRPIRYTRRAHRRRRMRTFSGAANRQTPDTRGNCRPLKTVA